MGMINVKKNYSFLCDYASVTREGKLSMNGIFESFNSKAFPLIFPSFFVVVNISGARNGDAFICDLVFEGDNSRKIFSIKGQVKIDSEKNFGFIGQLINVNFEKAGNYEIVFYIAGNKLESHSFQVRKIS